MDVIAGDFEWDEEKNTANILKHRVSFEEAATAFADPRHLVLDDGAGRNRYSLIGFSLRARLLTVVHVERGGRERIISARAATPSERALYEKW